MVTQYRGQPWQSPGAAQRNEADLREQYQEYLRQLNQQYQNQATGAYNTISTQQANERLSNLGLNFAGDTGQQALAAARMQGDIGQLGAQQDRARQEALLDIRQLQFQREQQRLNMVDDLQRTAYQRGSTQVRSPFQEAMARLGY